MKGTILKFWQVSTVLQIFLSSLKTVVEHSSIKCICEKKKERENFWRTFRFKNYFGRSVTVRRSGRSSFFQREEKSGALIPVSFPICSFSIHFRVFNTLLLYWYTSLSPAYSQSWFKSTLFSPALLCALSRHFPYNPYVRKNTQIYYCRVWLRAWNRPFSVVVSWICPFKD